MEYESWKLTDFNIDGHIVLDEKFGLIKIMRSDDGVLTLIGDTNYGLIDQTKPTPANFLNTSSLLGFVLDIGVQREKQLTRNGFYFGTDLIHPQSVRIVTQKDFDVDTFQKIALFIESNYQSKEKTKETKAIRTQLLIDTYNDARLLFPNFLSESYLNLMRIIDALSNATGGYDFAIFVAKISPLLNKEITDKLDRIEAYKSRVGTALEIFEKCLKHATDRQMTCLQKIKSLGREDKIVFACFFVAYQYRNKFVHNGFPFPNSVNDAWGLKEDSGTAYLSPVLGMSWSRMNRQDGLKEGDQIDIHEIMTEKEFADFKDTYFQLLPTWYFMKQMARKALLKEAE